MKLTTVTTATARAYRTWLRATFAEDRSAGLGHGQITGDVRLLPIGGFVTAPPGSPLLS